MFRLLLAVLLVISTANADERSCYNGDAVDYRAVECAPDTLKCFLALRLNESKAGCLAANHEKNTYLSLGFIVRDETLFFWCASDNCNEPPKNMEKTNTTQKRMEALRILFKAMGATELDTSFNVVIDNLHPDLVVKNSTTPVPPKRVQTKIATTDPAEPPDANKKWDTLASSEDSSAAPLNRDIKSQTRRTTNSMTVDSHSTPGMEPGSTVVSTTVSRAHSTRTSHTLLLKSGSLRDVTSEGSGVDSTDASTIFEYTSSSVRSTAEANAEQYESIDQTTDKPKPSSHVLIASTSESHIPKRAIDLPKATSRDRRTARTTGPSEQSTTLSNTTSNTTPALLPQKHEFFVDHVKSARILRFLAAFSVMLLL